MTIEINQKVICNGYPGTITKVCDGVLSGMVEVRLNSGDVCIDIKDLLVYVKNSEYGCRNCLYNSIECTNASNFNPSVSHDGKATCKGYTYYD